jgi:ABC-type uncharacterized transport system involved in gliding motility auxiliary subunit
MTKRNKTDMQRYAFVALIISGLALLATAAIWFLIGLNRMELFNIGDLEKWKMAGWISLALVVIGIAAYGIIDPDQVRRFFSKRQTRYGSNSLILALAVIGILFVANMLVFQNPDAFGFPIDMTEGQTNTLAPETLQALETLPGKVTAIAFFSGRMDSSAASELLMKYKVNSNGKFDYRFADPDQDPVAAREAGITGDGKILLRLGDKQEIVSYADESEITGALIRLISPEARAVYFMTAHGEADITGAGDVSMSVAKGTLERKNYTVNSLNLLAEKKIPEDALAIVIPGPTEPLTAQEVELLKAYLDQGGGLIVMQDPSILTDIGEAADPLAEYLSTAWGIELHDDLVVDLTNSGNEQYAISSILSSEHPITQSMTKAAIMPQARSIGLGEAPENAQMTLLAQTTEQSWGETDFESIPNIQYDEGSDVLGPLTLAVAGENYETGGRLVVFGDMPFASDEFFDVLGNGDIFINAIDWAAEQENLIQITPRQAKERTFQPPSNIQWLMVFLGSICIIPGLVVAAGVYSWLSRRKRG